MLLETDMKFKATDILNSEQKVKKRKISWVKNIVTPGRESDNRYHHKSRSDSGIILDKPPSNPIYIEKRYY